MSRVRIPDNPNSTALPGGNGARTAGPGSAVVTVTGRLGGGDIIEG